MARQKTTVTPAVPAVPVAKYSGDGFIISHSGTKLTLEIDLTTVMATPEKCRITQRGGLEVSAASGIKVPLAGTDNSLIMNFGVYGRKSEWVNGTKSDEKKLTAKEVTAKTADKVSQLEAESAEIKKMLAQLIALQSK